MIKTGAAMKKGRIWICIIGIVSVLLLLETPLIHAWEFREFFAPFHLFVSVEEEYRSNIFLTNRHPQDDSITNVSAGLTYSKAEKNYGIDLNYQMGYIFYANHHDLNFLSIGPSTLNAWYAVAPRLTFRIRDYIIRSDEGKEQLYESGAQSNQYLLSTVRGNPAIYIRNVVEPSIDYQFGRENFFSVIYRNIYYNIDSNNPRYEDSMENTINPKLTYWFDIHNGISLDYYFTYDTYQRSPDQFIHAVTPRYTYRFDPRTSIFGEFHFEYQDFKSPGVDYNVYNPSLGIQYKFSPTLSGTAQVGYFWQVPVQGGKTEGLTFNLSLAKSMEKTTYTLAFNGGYTEDYITAQNLGFTRTYGLYGTIKHQLTQRLSLGLTGSVRREEYSADRKDWVYGIWGDASYLILKWLTASLQVSYEEDHSNIKIESYRDIRGSLKLTANF
jgi:hypothetical protein